MPDQQAIIEKVNLFVNEIILFSASVYQIHKYIPLKT
jgi:hypothetical protein